MAVVGSSDPSNCELVAARARAANDIAALQVESADVLNQRNALAADDGPVLYLSRLVGIPEKTATRWFVLGIACCLISSF
jgi:hypothetical protein